MLAGFADLDPQNRAGVLSRAALDIQSGGVNPDSAPVLPDELTMRQEIVEEVLANLKTAHVQESEHDLRSKMLDWLDSEAERLSGPHDTEGAIRRLSTEAALPADVYEVVFSVEMLKAIANLHVDDRDLVRQTVRSPDLEEQFGSSGQGDQPKLVSIFGRWFDFGRERDRFLLVATGQRDERVLTIQHYFRVYPADVPLFGANELHQVLERFTRVYGLDFRIGDWTGKYLFHRKILLEGETLKVGFKPKERGRGLAVFTFLIEDGYADVALGLGVDLELYRKDLLKHAKHEERTTIKPLLSLRSGL